MQMRKISARICNGGITHAENKGEFPPSGNPTLFNIEIGKALFLGSTPVNNISIATRPV
jgi:hypothetical protein